MRIAGSNADSARDWDGATGEFWARRADRIDAGVARYHEPLLAAAAIEPIAAVLDIGCGSGQLTRDAARLAGAGCALGVDLSSPLLALARRLADEQGLSNAAFEQADAQVHTFAEGRFDVAVSRHGAMFFGDPAAAFGNIARALRPGGRLALLTWQPYRRNEWLWSFRTALAAGNDLPAAGPFSLSEPDTVRAVLGAAGFTDIRLRDLREPMWFGDDADDALDFVAGQHAGLLERLDPASRPRALTALRATLLAHETPDGVLYDSATWLVDAVLP